MYTYNYAASHKNDTVQIYARLKNNFVRQFVGEATVETQDKYTEEVVAKCGDALVGVYAYNEHISPTSPHAITRLYAGPSL